MWSAFWYVENDKRWWSALLTSLYAFSTLKKRARKNFNKNASSVRCGLQYPFSANKIV